MAVDLTAGELSWRISSGRRCLSLIYDVICALSCWSSSAADSRSVFSRHIYTEWCRSIDAVLFD